jgi:TatD DNase family protein
MIPIMNLHYIDIHSHLNLSPLRENQDAIVQKMKEEGIGTITVGTGLETSREAIRIAEKYPDMCWATIGIHPTDTEDIFDEATFLELANHPCVVAIGETGLDYFRDQSEVIKEKQKVLFKQHITLAKQVHKPLMLHVRASQGSDDAYYDALQILPNDIKANFHFFSGSVECMQDIIARGYTISVDGPITFTDQYDEMIRACPLESLMIETDAPFAAPVPYRGQTCEPWMVIEVAKKIAAIKKISLTKVQKIMRQNTTRFFEIEV